MVFYYGELYFYILYYGIRKFERKIFQILFESYVWSNEFCFNIEFKYACIVIEKYFWYLSNCIKIFLVSL